MITEIVSVTNHTNLSKSKTNKLQFYFSALLNLQIMTLKVTQVDTFKVWLRDFCKQSFEKKMHYNRNHF